MKEFKLSIITVTYNSLKELIKTRSSILLLFEKYPLLIEHIIIDGNSNDGTLNFLKKPLKFNTRYLCEKDNGIYDAMNKGIKLSRGEYILFLNSGDELNKEFIQHFDLILSDIKKKVDLICWNVIQKFQHKNKFSIIKPNFRKVFIHHQGTLINSNLHSDNLYDLTFKYASDFDFFKKIFRQKKITFTYIDKNLTTFYLGGVSNSKYTLLDRHIERLLILNQEKKINISSLIKYWVLFFFKILIINFFGYETFIGLKNKLSK